MMASVFLWSLLLMMTMRPGERTLDACGEFIVFDYWRGLCFMEVLV